MDNTAASDVDWKPIYISATISLLSIALFYYKQVLEILALLKISIDMLQGMLSNRHSLSHLLFGWTHYVFGIKHEYGFGSSSTAQQIALQNMDNLYNHTIVVTGGNSGIGYSLCNALCQVSHQQSQTINDGTHCCIIMASRNKTKSETAIKQLLKQFPKADIRFIPLDLSSLQSIISFINALQQLSSDIQNNIKILINNAGISMIKEGESVKFDDILDQRFEKTFTVNYLGPFILTQLMFDNYFKKNNECVIVNTSSIIHTVPSCYWIEDFPDMNKIALYHLDKEYNHVISYGLSKLFNIIHAKMMADEYKKHKVLINACHPGTSWNTGILSREHSSLVTSLMGIVNKLLWFLLKTNDECAATSMLLACDERIKANGITGAYFEDCGRKNASDYAKNQIITNKLKEYSFSIYNSIK